MEASWYESMMRDLSLWWLDVEIAAKSAWATWLGWTAKWPELWYVGGITLAVVLLTIFILVGMYYYWHIHLPRRARKAEKQCRQALDAFQDQWRRLGGNPDRDPLYLVIAAMYQEALKSAGEVWRTWFLWRHCVTRRWLDYLDSPEQPIGGLGRWADIRMKIRSPIGRHCAPDDLFGNMGEAVRKGSEAMQEIERRWPVSQELRDLAKRAVKDLVPLTKQMWVPYGGFTEVYGYLWLRLIHRGVCVPGDNEWLREVGLRTPKEIETEAQSRMSLGHGGQMSGEAALVG